MNNVATDYEKQGLDFLKETGTKMTVKFIKNDIYFDGDKEPRDIYRVTFRRNRDHFTIKFGQSIADTGKEPSAYTVLSCLTKSDPGSFEEFCADYGFDTDSRSAYKTFINVGIQWKKISAFWTDEEIEKLQEVA